MSSRTPDPGVSAAAAPASAATPLDECEHPGEDLRHDGLLRLHRLTLLLGTTGAMVTAIGSDNVRSHPLPGRSRDRTAIMKRSAWKAIALAWLAACVAATTASRAFAAPDEEALGKAEGYPACAPALMVETRCVVGLMTRRDETWPARVVPRGERVHAFKRVASEPVIPWRYELTDGGVDDYLAGTRTTGLLILKDDTILVERYQYDRTSAHRMNSMSMAKTVVAMLIGIALADGAIASIDDRVDKYVADLRGTPYGETTLRHLLMMASGVRFREFYSGSDDLSTLGLRSALHQSEGGTATVAPFTTRERPPGEAFNYSSADSQVLGLVLRAATGHTLADYLSEKIWKPMGAEADASWLVDKGGYEIGYAGINATLRDWGRFGMLLANGGTLGGRRIIPSAWVRAATTPAGKAFEPGGPMFFGYGYQTWILPGRERQFLLRGLRRQMIFVDPRAKLVMVSTAVEGVGGSFGPQLALWNGVTRRFATPPSSDRSRAVQ